MKRIGYALFFSVALHILAPFIENMIGPSREGVLAFDRWTSWPARLGSELVPFGHGIPQLVFPFFFSLIFYAALFWVLVAIYRKLRT
jgi:hypothetical protein